MKKSDLKTGMIVTLRNGEERMIFLNTHKGDVLVNHTGKRRWGYLAGYSENLRIGLNYDLDIMAVTKPQTVLGMFKDQTKIIWQRCECEECEIIYRCKKCGGEEVKGRAMKGEHGESVFSF